MVKVCVLRGLGINADEELAAAFEAAGARPSGRHVNDLADRPGLLDEYDILAFPGGFSYGDHLGSGRVLALLLRRRLGRPLRAFVAGGGLVLGICNGFQVLVKAGLLPDLSGRGLQEASLIHNDSGRFEDRWVRVRFEPESRCLWTRGLPEMELPVRHGEGKFVMPEAGRLVASGQIALCYARRDGGAGIPGYPDNPNGSVSDIAGICDPSGRVLGLMPHPEAFPTPRHAPRWTREAPAAVTGIAILRRGVEAAARGLGTDEP